MIHALFIAPDPGPAGDYAPSVLRAVFSADDQGFTRAPATTTLADLPSALRAHAAAVILPLRAEAESGGFRITALVIERLADEPLYAAGPTSPVLWEPIGTRPVFALASTEQRADGAERTRELRSAAHPPAFAAAILAIWQHLAAAD